jgi:hypothetical protein
MTVQSRYGVVVFTVCMYVCMYEWFTVSQLSLTTSKTNAVDAPVPIDGSSYRSYE